MTKQLILKLTIFFTAIIFTACSNLPSDEEVKKIILDHEKNEIKGPGKNAISFPCGMSKAFVIPKTFKHISDIMNAAQKTDQYENMMSDQQLLMDNLAVAGIISMDKTRDETFMNGNNRMITAKEYNISLTNKGNEILLGQDGDTYILSIVDLNDMQIVEKKNQSDSLLKVKYLRTFNSAYDVLNKFCQDKKENSLPKDTGFAILTYKDKSWKYSFGL